MVGQRFDVKDVPLVLPKPLIFPGFRTGHANRPARASSSIDAFMDPL
jgi:hypothetical protein